MLNLINITKKYGNYLAVDDINLEVKKGEIFSFLGVNGAGKTTTLKMIVGLLRPSSGKIIIDGLEQESNVVQTKRITGYIPDRPYLYDGLTGAEFLGFIANLYELDPKKSKIRSQQLLERYLLDEWSNELIESYSHGMKQRIAMCAALLPEPKLLVVDEPMVGLDPHGAKLLKDSFREYAKSGMTIFLSTHSLGVAEELSDRISLLHKGKIIAIGDLEHLRSVVGESGSNLEQVFLRLTTE